MSSVNDAIETARAHAQNLHKRVTAVSSQDQAAIQADFRTLAVEAEQLAGALRSAAQGERPNAKHYLDDAAALLQDAAKHAQHAANVTQPEFDAARAAIVASITDSIQRVSHAVADKRSALNTARK